MKNEDDKKWYFEKKGEQIGPVTVNTIRARVESNNLTYGDMIWQKGDADWVKLEESELKYLLEDRPPPSTKGKISNGLIWFLLFFPVFIYAIASPLQRVHESQFFTLRIVLIATTWTVIFAIPIIDSLVLRRKGYNTGKFHWWFLFTAVYLYRRAKSLDHGMICFSIYMIVYIVVPIGMAIAAAK